jgi:hypothetical protein
MTLARLVFAGAGIWGIAVLTPLFFLVDITGRPYAAPTDYPHFFYGFLAVALSWQLVFLVIASDPVRYRLLMLPSIVEKAGYVVAVTLLRWHGRIDDVAASTAVPDLVLGLLFVFAFLRTRVRDTGRGSHGRRG